jgi:rod shape determining protein RodA
MLPAGTSWYTPRVASIFIVISMIVLIVIGIVAINVSEHAEGVNGGLANKQMVFAIMGLGGFVIAVVIPYQKIGAVAYLLFGITLLLLVVVFFLPAVRGAHRWIDLKVFKFQPSELAKLSYIILLAWYLRLGDHYRKLLGLIPPFLLTFIPMVLILREPDLGTALLFLPTLFFMLYMAGAKLRHLVGIIFVAITLVFIPIPRSTQGMSPGEISERKATAYWTVGNEKKPDMIVSAAMLAMMKKHQLPRIDGWLRQSDPDVVRDKGFHLYHSKIVLGSGKLTGSEDWTDADWYFRILPDDHTDFIFSIAGGQWGFVGCIFVLLLYAVILLLGIEVAATTYDPFGRLLGVGVIGLLVSQMFINVGMTMGIMPITGMTLPLVSYGGSSLVVNCIALGLLVNVAQRRPILLGRRPFEHKEDTSHAPYRPLEGVDLPDKI